jgi:hypothetical protein
MEKTIKILFIGDPGADAASVPTLCGDKWEKRRVPVGRRSGYLSMVEVLRAPMVIWVSKKNIRLDTI